MKVIAGLGNPGPKYETTRHNAGFLALDRLVDVWNARGPTKENGGELYEASVAGEKILLARPLTYMNNSGKFIAPVFKFFKCEPADLIVIHDEADLPPGALRIKTGGGTAGHNGLRSLDAFLGADLLNYHRIRIGVGKPLAGSPVSTADYLLGQFEDQELERLDLLLDQVVKAAEMIVHGNVQQAMNQFNVRETLSAKG